MKKILISIALIPALIWGIWIALPERYLQERIESSINDGNLSIETEGLKKMLFYKFTIDRLALNGYGKEQVSLHNIRALVELPAFIRLKLSVPFHGDIGRGTISGNLIRTLSGEKIEMTIENARMSDIPCLKRAGIQGSGTLSGRFTMTNGAGHAEFVTHNAQFQPVVLSDMIVPLNLFSTARGALDVKGDTIHISSLALEGKDIYARLQGEVDHAFMELSMEIMPGKSFLDNPLFISALERYEISPGYYVLHLKRDLRRLMSL